MKFDQLMEQVIGVLAVLILVGGTAIVIAPFFTTLLWGAILAYCSWYPFRRLSVTLGGKPLLAMLLLILLILIVLIGPIFYAGIAFSTQAPDLVKAALKRLSAGAPPLPDWISSIPLIGAHIDDLWNGIVTRNPEVVARLRDLAGPLFRTALGATLATAQGLGLLILSVLFVGFFYLSGEKLAVALRVGMQHIAGARAEYLLGLIGGTVKGVVYGILGTSLLQAILCAAGYWFVGLPSVALLGLITFFLGIIPGGPTLLILPCAIWLMQTGKPVPAAILVVWSMLVGFAINNVLQPMIIGKSSHMPFILIFLGILGGAATFGLLGVFIGPTVLAVAYAVLSDWTKLTVAENPVHERPEVGKVLGAKYEVD